MKSVKKMKWKLLHKDHLEQFFIDFKNLFLWQIVHHKELIIIMNCVRGIKCQRNFFLTIDVPTWWNLTSIMIMVEWDKRKTSIKTSNTGSDVDKLLKTFENF